MLLTPDQFREHVATALEDDALRRLLDDAEAAITASAGPYGAPVTELVGGGFSGLVLSRDPASVTTIREASVWSSGTSDWSTVTTSDYYAISGSVLYRRAGRWKNVVEVTYLPANDAARRINVQIQLVELALNWKPGLAANTAGNWNESFPNADEYEAQRAAILAQLHSHAPMAVI